MTNQEFAKIMRQQNKAWRKVIVVLEQLNDNAQQNLDELTKFKKALK